MCHAIGPWSFRCPGSVRYIPMPEPGGLGLGKPLGIRAAQVASVSLAPQPKESHVLTSHDHRSSRP